MLELKLTIDAIPISIVVLDAGGAVMDVNQMVLEYTGLAAEDVRSADFRERFLHPDDWERLKEPRRQGLASDRRSNWSFGHAAKRDSTCGS